MTETAGRAEGLDVDGLLSGFADDLDAQPLTANTRRAYQSRVRGFLEWLAATPAEGDPLADPHARDWAVRDYTAHLKTTGQAKPSSVNLSLAAIDAFYRHLGLGQVNAAREALPSVSPRALDADEQKRLLRAVEAHASTRDRGLTSVLFYTGLRLGELAALNRDDVALSARKGTVTVRAGKNERWRQVPLNAEARAAVEAWLHTRADQLGELDAGEDQAALWLNRWGGRLTTRAIDQAIRRLAGKASVEASAHTLRHTCLTNLVRATDLVMVAELAGHRRLETTRRYSLPSDADRQAAMETLTIDY